MIAIVIGLGLSLAAAAPAACDAPLAGPRTPLERAKAVRRVGFVYVKVQRRQAARVAAVLARSGYRIAAPTWDRPPYPPRTVSFDHAFTYFLALDAINYMYRHPETKQTYEETGVFGAALLAGRLTTHLDRILTPRYLATLTLSDAHRMFGARVELPEVPRRVMHLRAVGQFLERRPQGNWKAWLRQFPSALDVARHLAQNIEGFNDPFLKRAQLFVGQLIGRYPGARELPRGVRNLDGLSVFADYILPMVLWRMSVIDYAPEVETKIARSELIPVGSRLEQEIRAATLIAADALLSELRKYPAFAKITVLDLDAALWLQGREIEFEGSVMPDRVFRRPETLPHLTMTANY